MKWKVSNFILPTRTSWNLHRVNSCFEFDDARRIAVMELPSTSADDFQYWSFHKSGRFTVKTAYDMLAAEDHGLASPFQGIDFFKILWALKILPKWKLFLWKLFHNGMATKVNISKRGIQLLVTCDLCSTQNEDFNIYFVFVS